MKVTSPSIPTSKSSQDTKRRRSQELSKIRRELSGEDVQEQLSDELKMVPKDERKSLMKEVKFDVHIPAEQGLAMKADLCLPWKKLRVMRRYIIA